MRRSISTVLTAAMALSAVAFAPVAVAAPVLKTVRPTTVDVRTMPTTTGDVTVAYYAAGGEAKAVSAARGKGARVEKRAQSLGAVVVDPPVGVSPEEFAADIEKTPGIRYAEPVRPMRALYTPNDPWSSEQWGLKRIQMPAAWDVTQGSSEVTVAVVDTGFDFGTLDRPVGIDTVNDRDFSVTPPGLDAIDLNGHGTHTAGIIAAATNNNAGIASVAPNVRLLPIRVFYADGSSDDVIVSEGIRYAADMGADVINLSLGGDFDTPTLKGAVDYALSAGCVVVAASGNDARGAILYPAAYASVIAVGAIDANSVRAGFSNYGPTLDLSAPGVNILSLYTRDPRTGESRAAYLSGTSEAAPHVAGVAALLRSLHPAWSETMVSSALSASAEDLGPLGRDDYYGYGLVRADRATRMVGTYAGLEGAPTNPSWGSSARIVGTLWSESESFLATRPVSIEAKPSGAGSWSEVATTSTSPSGAYAVSVWPKKQTAYRAHFRGETGVVEAYSASKTITPKAYLTPPSRPRRVYAGRRFTSRGYLKPAHRSGGRSVAIRCYKWSRSARKYKYHHTAWATNGDTTSAGTRYSRRLRLPHKGKWKLVARTWGGTDHATTYSPPRYVYAR